MIKSLCIYCASSSNIDASYKALAADIGVWVAARNIEIVYGGGHVGLMGIVADSALEVGGAVSGVIPTFLQEREVAHARLTTLHVTPDMQSRQKKMADLADAFLVLPGGVGTLAELSEILTWRALDLHAKPIIIYDINGYWDGFLAWFDHAIESGFIKPHLRGLLHVVKSLEDLADVLK